MAEKGLGGFSGAGQFSEWWLMIEPALRRRAFRLIGDEGQDALQEVAIEACESFDSIESVEHFTRWCYQGLHWRIIDQRIKRGTQDKYVHLFAKDQDDSFEMSPESRFERLAKQLPIRQIQVAMDYANGWKAHEIAKRRGISLHTVRKTWKRAKEGLRNNRLQEIGDELD